MFAQVVVCAPRSSPDLHSRLAALQLWPSMQQVFVKFSHNDGDWGCSVYLYESVFVCGNVFLSLFHSKLLTRVLSHTEAM